MTPDKRLALAFIELLKHTEGTSYYPSWVAVPSPVYQELIHAYTAFRNLPESPSTF